MTAPKLPPPRGAQDRIHLDRFQHSEIEYEAAVANRIPCDIMPATPDRQRQFVLSDEADRSDHIR